MRLLEEVKICLLALAIGLAVLTQGPDTPRSAQDWPSEIKAQDLSAPQWSPAG